jgi:cysteinyl-tRNA synthetase
MAKLAVLGVAKADSGQVSSCRQPKRALGLGPRMIFASPLKSASAFIANKDWGNADRIRDELAGRGIALRDGKDRETGERTTTWEVKR